MEDKEKQPMEDIRFQEWLRSVNGTVRPKRRGLLQRARHLFLGCEVVQLMHWVDGHDRPIIGGGICLVCGTEYPYWRPTD